MKKTKVGIIIDVLYKNTFPELSMEYLKLLKKIIFKVNYFQLMPLTHFGISIPIKKL